MSRPERAERHETLVKILKNNSDFYISSPGVSSQFTPHSCVSASYLLLHFYTKLNCFRLFIFMVHKKDGSRAATSIYFFGSLFFFFYNSAASILCIRFTLLAKDRSINLSPICTCKPPKISGLTLVSIIKVSPGLRKEALNEPSNDFNCAFVNSSADVTTDSTSPRDARISSAYFSLILPTSPRRPFSASVPKNADDVKEKVPLAQMAAMSCFLSALRIVGFFRNRANVTLLAACSEKFYNRQGKKEGEKGSTIQKQVSVHSLERFPCGCEQGIF